MTEQQERVLLETHSAVARLEGVLTGGNGGGLVKQVADEAERIIRIEEEVDDIRENMITRRECGEKRSQTTKRKRNSWLVAKDVLLVILACATILFGSGVLR